MVGYIRPERSYDSLGKTDQSPPPSSFWNLRFFMFFSHFYVFWFIFVPTSPSLTDALITAINNDIEEAKVKLELPEHLKLKEDNFFTNAPSLPSSKVLANSSTSQTIMNGHWPLAVTAAHTDKPRQHLCTHSEIWWLLPWLNLDIIMNYPSFFKLFFLLRNYFTCLCSKMLPTNFLQKSNHLNPINCI